METLNFEQPHILSSLPWRRQWVKDAWLKALLVIYDKKNNQYKELKKLSNEWLKRDHGTRMSREESENERNQGAGRLENAK